MCYKTAKAKDSLIAKLEAAQTALAEAKRIENELRLKVADKVFDFDQAKLQKGTETYEMSDGRKAKIEFKLGVTVDQKEVPDCIKWLISKGLEQHEAEAVFRVKYELATKAYKKLDKKLKKGVDSIITRKPGTPGFKVVS